jgi:glycine/D-amino acid oxidase-like deaminating enzyme/nitrite reductase/ring-hydroxylating ferredoxin subunit
MDNTQNFQNKPDAGSENWKRDGENPSLWNLNTQITVPDSATPGQPIYDALIVGAGITGLTTALLLQKAGRKCIVADAHYAGFGTTGGTTAHINTFADTTFAEVEKAFSEDAAKQFAQAIAESVQTIHELVRTYNIDCDFEWRRGFVYAETDCEVSELDDLFESAVRAGVAVSETREVPTSVPYQKAVVFENQAQFHPLKYIGALQEAFLAAGGMVLENTPVSKVESTDAYHIAISGNLKIKARTIVYATHIPPGGINLLHFRNAPYRSYVIAATLKDGAYPADLVYDMQDPYHYFRTHTIDGQKYLVAGGHDHKTGHGDPEQAFAELIAYTGKYYQIESVATKWSAQYYVPADGLPYIGQLPGASEGIYTATGFNGNGMILGTVSAQVLTDLILTGDSPYKDLFDPARIKPIAGFAEIVKENADVVKKFIGDRFGLEEVESFSQMPADSGRVVEYNGEKLAVYRDASGGIHALDPVCTHAKCIVQWNNSEKSWDCPCHGARFDCHGQVLTGPARRDLEQVAVAPPGKVV